MKKEKNNLNNMTTFIIVAGTLILAIFTVVIGINLLPNNESNSYYVKVGDEMSAKVESININNDVVDITTSGDTVEYCVKSTKSTPPLNNLCWKKVQNNTASFSIYKGKKYYIWVKDTNNNVSSPMSFNTNEKSNN